MPALHELFLHADLILAGEADELLAVVHAPDCAGSAMLQPKRIVLSESAPVVAALLLYYLPTLYVDRDLH